MLDRETQNILAQCSTNLELFCRVFLSEHFEKPFCAIHRKIFELLDADNVQKGATKAPRGIGKTSLTSLALPLRDILYQKAKYIVLVSKSADKAIEQTENIKAELEKNETIKKFFGDLKSNSWSKENWVTSTGIKILPRGAGQQIRGLNFEGFRPDLIIIDDLEDKEEVQNEVLRKKLKRWFMTDVQNSVDRHRGFRIRFIGTPLHEDSLIENLYEKPDEWKLVWADEKEKQSLAICGPDMNSLYPEFISNAEVSKILKDYRDEGLVDEFFREYVCQVIPGDEAPFTKSMFRYYNEVDLLGRANLETVVLCDPAKTTGAQSAYSAVVAVTFDLAKNEIYVRDVVFARLHPEEFYGEIFRLTDIYKATVIGIEVNSLNEYITYPFKTRMIAEGRFCRTIELKPRDKKENRVRALLPFYRTGRVYHRASCCDVLESQLLSFPMSRYWDAMDCLAYVIQLLEEGERYFYPADDEEDKLAIEEEYAELVAGNDPPMRNWRSI